MDWMIKEIFIVVVLIGLRGFNNSQKGEQCLVSYGFLSAEPALFFCIEVEGVDA